MTSRLGDPISRCRYDALMRWMRPPPPAPEQSGRKEKECSVTQCASMHFQMYALHAQCAVSCINICSAALCKTFHKVHWVTLWLIYHQRHLWLMWTPKSNFEMVRNIWQRETILCWGCVVYTPCLLVCWFICLISSRLGGGGDTWEL